MVNGRETPSWSQIQMSKGVSVLSRESKGPSSRVFATQTVAVSGSRVSAPALPSQATHGTDHPHHQARYRDHLATTATTANTSPRASSAAPYHPITRTGVKPRQLSAAFWHVAIPITVTVGRTEYPALTCSICEAHQTHLA